MAPSTPSQQTSAMLAVVWTKNRDLLCHRLDTIETFCRRLPDSAADNPLRADSAADAHKLAGSLGMFGLAEGTVIAREIEHRLNSNTLEELLKANITGLTAHLRNLIETYSVKVTAPQSVPRRRLLIVDSNAEAAHEVSAVAEKRGMQPSIAADLDAARQALERESFDLLVLDLATASLAGNTLGDDYADQVRDVVISRAPMQVLALTSVDTFEDRVIAAQIGAHGFLPKNVPAAEIVDTCEHLLDLQTSQFKVLTLDDDPTVLGAVQAILEQHSIRVTSITDPRLFWNALEETLPDLVILDLEMPNFSGLELCRAIRKDPQWNRLPVLFLSFHGDAESVTSIFSAGADDFVPKPIIDIELSTRVRNRLERDRLYRTLSDYDQLTGVRNRRSSNVVIANYLRLAERHGLPLSLVVIDLDKFKRVNDTYGHQAGDDVLQYLGGLLRQSFRGEDVVARWGGEEFLIAMFAMRRSDAIERVANVLERLEEHEFESSPGTRFHVSFSAGLAVFPDDGKELHTLYRLADEALYRAKAGGGRRIYPVKVEHAGSEAHSDIAIVSGDVTLSAPLRHALEMRGYAVDLFQKGPIALHELCENPSGTRARVVIVDEFPDSTVTDLIRGLRHQLAGTEPTVFLLLSPNKIGDNDGEFEGVERVAKPFKSSSLMQRLRRVLAR
jgi:diguanylate cyclase (GGDEF)-like protein